MLHNLFYYYYLLRKECRYKIYRGALYALVYKQSTSNSVKNNQ